MADDSQPGLREAFTSVMADVCTPVAVVTALDGDRPHGTTVSAFASLSLRPPMVLVALGAVRAAATTPGKPLTYHNRVFGTHATLEGDGS